MPLTRRLAAAVAFTLAAAAAHADPLGCDVSAYKRGPGLEAVEADNVLTITWDGDRREELRLRFIIQAGAPLIRDLSVRRQSSWQSIARDVTPDFRVVAGLRRMSNQQLVPLRGLGVEITPEVVDRYRWDPFWDAPLDLSAPSGRGGNPPPAAGIANQPGLPRNADEITRDSIDYRTRGCTVETTGARLTVTFPGVRLGVFDGVLQYTFFAGTNLIRQEVVAKTSRPWVAYKYDAGLKGLSLSAVAWRDTANAWKNARLDQAKTDEEVPLKAANRLVVADRGAAGSIAILPPPHNFFWAREIAINLGYNFYRRDTATTFSVGIRQAEHEDESENQANFALYSARPGSLQRMTVFLYPTTQNARAAADAVLAFTHDDKYKPLPGYQVMNHHYHMDLGQRLGAAGSLDAEIPDLVALKALGLNIVSQIDSVGVGNATPADALQIRANSIEGARRKSDRTFLVMADQEYYNSPLGGHTDLLFSRPVYWTGGREAGQPLSEPHPKYGTVYHIGNAADLMEMAKREDVLINMPHPRTKGSTGFPDAVKAQPFFTDPHYQGIGFRWGMGLDRSETRLCEYRCQPLIDDMNNWIADTAAPPKYLLSISEVRHMQPGDEIYSSSPVTYVKLAALPAPDDPSPVIKALMRGDSFVTSGEVLIPRYEVRGDGAKRTIAADVEWTFPLDFVEVIWGDGTTSGRQVIPTTELAPMGRHHFEIPFDATGKKWVRFAAWDCAGNGAMAQPVKVSAAPRP